ncbi:MAG: hypothetical protein M1819_007072 [Sarea resinae]|nr:MAG: hypothetical protein M1819_007072 [Sarea resinae]
MERSLDTNDAKESLDLRDEEAPLRASLEDAYRSSSDEDESRDGLRPLNEGFQGAEKNPRKRGRVWRSAAGPDADRNLDGRRWLEKYLRPWRSCIVITLLVLALLLLVLSGGGYYVYRTAPLDGQSPSWYPSPIGGTVGPWEESYRKATELVNKMSLIEKVNITSGTGWMQGLCVGNTGPANRVGFPALCLQDGPLGIRFADQITAFPAGVTTGATWNKKLMYQRGNAHGLEARLKGVNVLLGPSMGPLGRMPCGGRNWEGFGSDPVLQGIAAAETIRGIQDQGVIATAKHYVLNEQEHFRQSFEWGLPNAVSSNIDDRTLRELYVWPFADSVRAGVGSVMCSYNMVNNSYACGNSIILNGILKDELGFQGFVQSDWLAQRSGVASALAGLDMSMPGDGLRWMDGNSLWGAHLTRATLNSSLPISRLNDMVVRIVAAWYQLGQDDKSKWPSLEDGGGPNFSSWTDDKVGLLYPGSDDNSTGVVNKFIDAQGKGNNSHGLLARKIAAEGTVLVKNTQNVLPLNRKGWSKEEKAGREAKYRVGIFGEDAREGRGANVCADRGCNQGTLAQGWGSGTVEFPYLITPVKAISAAFDFHSVYVTDFPGNHPPSDKNPQAVEDQDLCMVFINSDGGEGYIASEGIRGDRNDLYPQKGGDKLVQHIASRCGGGKGKTIVVVHAVGPVVLDKWIDMEGVNAVLLANLPGEESGNALVDVLFGDVDASGRLPYTVGKSLADYGPGGQILYYPNGVVPQQNFTEGLYIDYRHFDAYNITPRFEFGFGLSYTTFELSDISLKTIGSKTPLADPRPASLVPPALNTTIPPASEVLFPEGFKKLKKYVYPYLSSLSSTTPGPYPLPPGYSHTPHELSPAGGAEGGNPSLWAPLANLSVTVKNTGSRTGKTVVQLYVSFPSDVKDVDGSAIDFPVKVLRGFEKVELEAGKSANVDLELTRRDLSYWSTVRQNWVLPTEGRFKFWVGSSSRDLPLSTEW